jgi:hypothetical protein
MIRRWAWGMLLAWVGAGWAVARAQVPAPAATPVAPAATPSVIEDPLLAQIDEAIKINSQRYLVAVGPNPNSPWQIFHGILAYRKDFLVRVGDQKMSAIEWVATGEPRFDNQPLLLLSPHGAKFHPFTREYAFEGHPGQTLALLSESHLPVEYEFKIGNQKVMIADFLNCAMMEVGVNPQDEITWMLWGLNNYLKPDAQWNNQQGQPWSIERLVQVQVAAPVVGGACGGNHGLFAITRARDKYLKTGRPLRGVWLQADNKIKQHVEIARSLQNADGTFSSDFYRGGGYTRDMNQRFNTTGHTMEFLSIGLPDSRLNEQWVRNAVHVLSWELIAHRKSSPSPGPLYHSINALVNYRDRVRKLQSTQLAAKPAEAAKSPATTPAVTAPQPVPVATQPATPAPTTANTPVTAPTTTPEVKPAAPQVPLTIPPPVQANLSPKAPDAAPTVTPPAPTLSVPSSPSTTAQPAPMSVPLPPATVAPQAVPSTAPPALPAPSAAVPKAPKPSVGLAHVAKGTPPAPLGAPPADALPVPLPVVIPATEPLLLPATTPKSPPRPTINPSLIQPGQLVLETPVSALMPSNGQ